MSKALWMTIMGFLCCLLVMAVLGMQWGQALNETAKWKNRCQSAESAAWRQELDRREPNTEIQVRGRESQLVMELQEIQEARDIVDFFDPNAVHTWIGTVDGWIGFRAVDRNDPNSGEVITDSSIRRLCASGRICVVLGHQWGKLDHCDRNGVWTRGYMCAICLRVKDAEIIK